MKIKLKNTSTKIERFLKSFSSKKRIEILASSSIEKDLSLQEISGRINGNIQNVSLHTFKLLNAGLIAKKQVGKEAKHILTKRVENILAFINKVDKIL